jgi:hypothetical protein
MENPYAKKGLLGRRGHSPNRTALATRKVCQNDEILDGMASRGSLKSVARTAVDKPLAQPYLSEAGPMAMTLISLRFWPLNPGLLNLHSFGECSRIGAGAAMCHDELIGSLSYPVTAATPNREHRNLA